MPAVGSTISFIVAERVANEVGADDEQLQAAELESLQQSRLMPSR
jgi:hypothetical protein